MRHILIPKCLSNYPSKHRLCLPLIGQSENKSSFYKLGEVPKAHTMMIRPLSAFKEFPLSIYYYFPETRISFESRCYKLLPQIGLMPYHLLYFQKAFCDSMCQGYFHIKCNGIYSLLNFRHTLLTVMYRKIQFSLQNSNKNVENLSCTAMSADYSWHIL